MANLAPGRASSRFSRLTSHRASRRSRLLGKIAVRVTAACSPLLEGKIAKRRCVAGGSARSRRGAAPIFQSLGKARRRSPGRMRVANPANESSRPAHRTVPARAWRGHGSVRKSPPERSCALQHGLTGLRTGAAWNAETMRASPLPRPDSGGRTLAQPALRMSGAWMRPAPSSRLISHRLGRAAETFHPRLHSAALLRPRPRSANVPKPRQGARTARFHLGQACTGFPPSRLVARAFAPDRPSTYVKAVLLIRPGVILNEAA